ncbi:MAG: 23S rRNA (pseudouridine(1915)-N(3))-methyltransferase RlmH [Mariprofundaceae bacterium]
MKFRLLVVGKGGGDLQGFESEFRKRLKPSVDFELVELPEGRAKQLNQRKQEEEKHILKAVRPTFILFDERGKTLKSRQWAEFFQTLSGGIELDFVVGGASGVSDTVRAKAAHCWSLSALTLPHQLVRALIVEQLYRAFTIIQGHPYHRD